jgi:hypothetical protein
MLTRPLPHLQLLLGLRNLLLQRLHLCEPDVAPLACISCLVINLLHSQACSRQPLLKLCQLLLGLGGLLIQLSSLGLLLCHLLLHLQAQEVSCWMWLTVMTSDASSPRECTACVCQVIHTSCRYVHAALLCPLLLSTWLGDASQVRHHIPARSCSAALGSVPEPAGSVPAPPAAAACWPPAPWLMPLPR